MAIDTSRLLEVLGTNDANNAVDTSVIARNKDGSICERLEDVTQELSGSAGIATFPAEAAADDGISLAEVIRFIQNSVRNGTGTALAANESLADILYAGNGVSVFPAEAAAANGISLAEVIRFIQNSVRNGTGTALAANESLADILYAGNGVSVFPVGAAPGNNISLAEVIRAIYNQTINASLNVTAVNYFTVTSDFTNIIWNTVASHEIATVTGLVQLTIIPQCTGTLTDAANLATIQLGIEGSTAAIIPVTGAAGNGGNTIDLNEFWVDATPADVIVTQTQLDALTVIVGAGLDVGYEIVGEALTGGSIIFHCWWKPLDGTGNCVAGAGGAL